MRYVQAKFVEADKAEAYRYYITDALYVIGRLNVRYADLIKPAPEETRTAEEIIQSISEKLTKIGGE